MKPKRLQWQVIDSTWEKAIGLDDGYFIADENHGDPVRLYYPWDQSGDYPDEFATREEAKLASQRHYEHNLLEIVRKNFDLSAEQEIAEQRTVGLNEDIYDRVGGNVDDAYSLGHNDGETFATRRLLSNLCCINEPTNSGE